MGLKTSIIIIWRFSAQCEPLTHFHSTYVNPCCNTFPIDRTFGNSHLGFPCGFRSRRCSSSSIVSRKRAFELIYLPLIRGLYPFATDMLIQKETEIQPRNGREERKLSNPGKGWPLLGNAQVGLTRRGHRSLFEPVYFPAGFAAHCRHDDKDLSDCGAQVRSDVGKGGLCLKLQGISSTVRDGAVLSDPVGKLSTFRLHNISIVYQQKK
jgi:hypothetical protein